MSGSLEERIKALHEGRSAIEAQFEHMKSLHARMNSLAREKFLSEWEHDSGIMKSSVLSVAGPGPSGVCVGQDDRVGRCCFAESVHDSGDVIFRERPCIILPLQCSVPGEKNDLLTFWETLTPEQIEVLNDFESHLESAPQDECLSFSLSQEEVLRLCAQGVCIQSDSLLRLRMVDRVNAHRFGLGSALFRTISKMEHSCRPNCRAFERNGMLEIVALRKVHSGERIALSYMADESLLFADTNGRRQYLQEKHHFFCMCDRCRALDVARSFCCTCGGDIWAVNAAIEPLQDKDDSTCWSCSRCGREMYVGDPQAPLAALLIGEKRALERWQKIKFSLGRGATHLVAAEEFVGIWLQQVQGQFVGQGDLSSDYEALQKELVVLRRDLLEFAPRHWLATHAALLSSLLLLSHAAEGHPVHRLDDNVASGVRDFVQLGARLFSEGSYVLEKLVNDVRSMLQDASQGRLSRRFALVGGISLSENASTTCNAPLQLMEMD